MRVRHLVGDKKGVAEHIRDNIGRELIDSGQAESAGWTDESNKVELASWAEFQIGDKLRLKKPNNFSEKDSNHKYTGNFRAGDEFVISEHVALCSSNGVLDDVAFYAEHNGRLYFVWNEFNIFDKV